VHQIFARVGQDNSREFFQRLEDLEKSFITGLTEGGKMREAWRAVWHQLSPAKPHIFFMIIDD
jgi:predicted Abi (CAAX) family protease